jgi:hypothetical protein
MVTFDITNLLDPTEKVLLPVFVVIVAPFPTIVASAVSVNASNSNVGVVTVEFPEVDTGGSHPHVVQDS